MNDQNVTDEIHISLHHFWSVDFPLRLNIYINYITTNGMQNIMYVALFVDCQSLLELLA